MSRPFTSLKHSHVIGMHDIHFPIEIFWKNIWTKNIVRNVNIFKLIFLNFKQNMGNMQSYSFHEIKQSKFHLNVKLEMHLNFKLVMTNICCLLLYRTHIIYSFAKINVKKKIKLHSWSLYFHHFFKKGFYNLKVSNWLYTFL